MQLTCSHCRAAWDFSDRRPSYCPFCGKSLPLETPTEPLPPPVALDSEAATVAVVPQLTSPGNGAEPETVGGYRLLRVLGVGGMGKVYEAEALTGGLRVALKLVSTDFAASTAAVERFRQEGQLASRIAHPRCVFVLAADEDAGRPYIVMELMPGDNLEDHVQHWGALPQAKAVALILDVMEGLQEAHRVGVVHRDVKPSNCFFGHDRRLKVGDFGLAKSLAQGVHLTRTGSFLGTPRYSSPEQVRGEPLDAQTDIYSVAATLYFLLTGRAPFQSDNAAVTLARIAADPVPPMRTLKPELALELDEVVLRGLERDRKRRWRTMEEFAEALRPFLPGKVVEAGPGLRFGALAIDLVLFWLLNLALVLAAYALGWTRLASGFGPTVNDLLSLRLTLLLLLYFGLSEGFLGWSPAKWLLRLRVRNAATGDPARPGRLLGRAAVFALLVTLYYVFYVGTLLFLAQPPSVASVDFTSRMSQHPFLIVLPEAGMFLGFVLLLCTVRARTGYRGLHEVLSGTRVVRLPRAARRGTTRLPAPRKPETPGPFAAGTDVYRPPGIPEKLGAFAVHGTLGWTDRAKVLGGFNAALNRRAVLWLRPAGEPPLSAERRDLNRVARLRWLAAGQVTEYRWDAFLAPDGGPLLASIASGGRVSWAQFQPQLTQLTDELQQAVREHTLPYQPGPELVWVRPDDGVLLLDFPLSDPETNGTKHDDPEGAALELLARVSVSALEGESPPADMPASVRVPLPATAAGLLRTLLAHERTGLPLRGFQKRLHALQDAPARITWWRRMGQLAVVTVFLFLTYGFCVPVMALANSVGQAIRDLRALGNFNADGQAIDDLDTAAVRDYLRSATSTDPLVRASGVATLGQDGPLQQQIQDAIDLRQHRLEERQKWSKLYFRDQVTRGRLPFGVRQPFSGFARPNVVRASTESLRAQAREIASRLEQENEWDTSQLALELFTLVAGSGLWVLGTLVLRRDLSYLIARIDLVRHDGQPAGRLRCLGRAFLVWGPFVVLLLLSHGLNDWCWAHWDGRAPVPTVLPAVALVLAYAAWLLLVVYLILALCFPRRGLHDYLAGTYPVPS